MTNNHNQDAFEHRFESVVNDAHERSDRGANPSSNVWKSIRAGLTDMQADTADSRATDVDSAPVSRRTQQMRKEAGMDIALQPGMMEAPTRANRRLLAWAATILVGVLVASGLFWYGQTPVGDDGNELAWAPGMGTAESTPTAMISSVCQVEPLTADQVLEMVLNPKEGYARLGNPQPILTGELWEPGQLLTPSFWTDLDLKPIEDPERAEKLETMGNEFIRCLQHGSSYQVWSFLDPILVQQMIISEFPVIRTESQLREFIETVGPQPFVDSGSTDLASLMRFTRNSSLHVMDEPNALLFSEPPDGVKMENGLGTIAVGDPDSTSFTYLLRIAEVSPDVWVIHSIEVVAPGD